MAAAPDPPEVSVIVPAFNAESTIEALLDGLASQVTARGFEVVVVNNASTDRTAAIVRSHHLAPRLIGEATRGSYAARDAGIRSAHGSIFAFVDADCVPAPEWLDAGMAAIEEGADLVAGRIDPRLGLSPTVWARYDAALYLDQAAQVAEEGFGATANLFVRRAVFDGVGEFDATLLSGGDLELCRRATAGGFVLAYADDAVVAHEPRSSLTSTWKLHRRLGAGWSELARRGLRGPWWRDPALRTSPGWVAWRSQRHANPLRVRHLLPVHLVAMGARWWGRLRGR